MFDPRKQTVHTFPKKEKSAGSESYSLTFTDDATRGRIGLAMDIRMNIGSNNTSIPKGSRIKLRLCKLHPCLRVSQTPFHLDFCTIPISVSVSRRNGLRPHLSKGSSGRKQKCTQFLTPFSGIVFHALSHGVVHFVRSVSFKNLKMEVFDWLLKDFNQ